jgi:hypothetical protein
LESALLVSEYIGISNYIDRYSIAAPGTMMGWKSCGCNLRTRSVFFCSCHQYEMKQLRVIRLVSGQLFFHLQEIASGRSFGLLRMTVAISISTSRLINSTISSSQLVDLNTNLPNRGKNALHRVHSTIDCQAPDVLPQQIVFWPQVGHKSVEKKLWS